MGQLHRSSVRIWPRAVLCGLAMLVLAASGTPPVRLGPPEPVAPGLDLFRLDDPSLLTPRGPVAVQLLRMDPRRLTLRSALALDQVLGTETVVDTARRHGAIAAINAGFFLPNGDPAGLLKLDHALVSDSTLQRGAVAVIQRRPGEATSLRFDRVSVVIRLRARGRVIAVDGIDTTRRPGRLAWFTPRFFGHTDTTEEGVDWILRGSPLTVVERRDGAMRTGIPRDGAVLSFGGRPPPPALGDLAEGDRVEVEPVFSAAFGTPPSAWTTARDIVAGAGLLVHRGRIIADWTAEQLRAGFSTERHPRTMIGVDGQGRIWLVTVDGRNPRISLGMNFAELQNLARVLGLREALNLDGGGSTTMVVRGAIVNHPSDAAGPRKVSDSLLVFPAGPR